MGSSVAEHTRTGIICHLPYNDHISLFYDKIFMFFKNYNTHTKKKTELDEIILQFIHGCCNGDGDDEMEKQ